MIITKEVEVEYNTVRVDSITNISTPMVFFTDKEEFFRFVNPEGTVFIERDGDWIQVQEEVTLILKGGVDESETNN